MTWYTTENYTAVVTINLYIMYLTKISRGM